MDNFKLVNIILYTLLITFAYATNSLRRFEYKWSFKGPHLVQADGSVPFWDIGGNAIPSDESIRITPSLRSKKGYVWSNNRTYFENWEIEVAFRISGRGRIGADGLAIWFTEEVGSEGTVFGSSDKWKGLGVFLDSFDNDNMHNNPYISAMANDGKVEYSHMSDGINQQLGGCVRDFRNKPFPVRVRIEYFEKALTVWLNNGMSADKKDYELCMRIGHVELPSFGYFGVSGATGGVAASLPDDHDVHSFLTYSLIKKDASVDVGVTEDEAEVIKKEFDDYYQKHKEAKESFKKEHPNELPYDEWEEDEFYESQDERQLKQIFDGQNTISFTIKDLNRKIDDIVGRQERALAAISLLTNAQPSGNMGSVNTDQLKKMIDVLHQEGRTTQERLREISQTMIEIRRTASSTGSNGEYRGEAAVKDLRSSVNNVQQDVKSLLSRPQAAPVPKCPAPEPVSCVSSFIFVTILVVQTVLLISFFYYWSQKEAAAKKFY